MDPAHLTFTRTHEWVAVEGQTATIGISDFAVKELTDVVHIELPQVGRTVSAGESIGEIESVKAVSDLYAPVSGEIIDVNKALEANLGMLSEDPFGTGWICKLRISNAGQLDQLLSHADYVKQCESH